VERVRRPTQIAGVSCDTWRESAAAKSVESFRHAYVGLRAEFAQCGYGGLQEVVRELQRSIGDGSSVCVASRRISCASREARNSDTELEGDSLQRMASSAAPVRSDDGRCVRQLRWRVKRRRSARSAPTIARLSVCNGLLGGVPSLAAMPWHLVTKFNHAVLVGFDLRQMEGHVFAELLEELDPVADQDRQD
jgi:hypothetical protein